tara:strand:+ start:760 stop:2028 length:1269 start_codon:yes stop_codon:yes gene_type:complete
MKSTLTLSIGIFIGLGLNLLWQNRIYEPNELLSDGSLESSYDTFIDSLVKAGEFVQTHEYYGSDREKAQAYIHILSSLISVIKQEIFIDTSFPYFNNLSTFSKVGMDNADQTYHQTFIDGSGIYKVWGTRGSSKTISFTTYLPDTLSKSLHVLDELKYEQDGSFEITLGGKNQNFANWMPLENTLIRLLVRQTYSDWDNEIPGTIHIDRIDKEKPSFPVINSRSVSSNLVNLGNKVLLNATRWPEYQLKRIEQMIAVNSISKPRKVGQTGGLLGRLMSHGHFNLKDDEVLIIKAWPTEAEYQGIQLGNPWWQSLDYANRITSLTADQSTLSSDGAYYYILSKTDPGYPNWLDIEDFDRGAILMRWDGLKDTYLDSALFPTAYLAKIDELKSFLPSDEQKISKDERINQILNRRKHVQKRFNY